MERRMAEVVVMKLGKENGPQLSVEEAMSMTKIKTDAYEVYARQKGDVTFLAWRRADGSIIIKIQCW